MRELMAEEEAELQEIEDTVREATEASEIQRMNKLDKHASTAKTPAMELKKQEISEVQPLIPGPFLLKRKTLRSFRGVPLIFAGPNPPPPGVFDGPHFFSGDAAAADHKKFHAENPGSALGDCKGHESWKDTPHICSGPPDMKNMPKW